MTSVAEVVGRLPSGLPARLHGTWQRLTAPTEAAEPFDPASVEHLPAPAQRWLRHAIAPGTPLRRKVVLRQHGTILLGRAWRRFTACQALAPLEGFLWPVTTHLFGLSIHGFDRYSDGAGEMAHRLLGLVPLVTSRGPDTSRSAAARHTSEVVWAPAAALATQVRWRPVDDSSVAMLIPCGPWTFEPTLTVSPDGAPQRITVPRWSNIERTGWHAEPFTAVVEHERSFGGYTVPDRVTAGWGYGTSRWDDGGAFIHLTIDEAVYL